MVIVGKYRPIIQDTLKKFLTCDEFSKVEFVIQKVAQGTGHAVQCTLPNLKEIKDKKNCTNVILNGDTPLIKTSTIREAIDSFISKGNNLLQITCTEFDDPSGLGRIIRNPQDNRFEKIVEDKDCTKEQLKVKLCNIGIYIANIDTLVKYLPFIDNKNAQNEYYLTDLVEITLSNKNDNMDKKIDLFEISKSKQLELVGINTKEQLEEIK